MSWLWNYLKNLFQFPIIYSSKLGNKLTRIVTWERWEIGMAFHSTYSLIWFSWKRVDFSNKLWCYIAFYCKTALIPVYLSVFVSEQRVSCPVWISMTSVRVQTTSIWGNLCVIRVRVRVHFFVKTEQIGIPCCCSWVLACAVRPWMFIFNIIF